MWGSEQESNWEPEKVRTAEEWLWAENCAEDRAKGQVGLCEVLYPAHTPAKGIVFFTEHSVFSGPNTVQTAAGNNSVKSMLRTSHDKGHGKGLQNMLSATEVARGEVKFKSVVIHMLMCITR